MINAGVSIEYAIICQTNAKDYLGIHNNKFIPIFHLLVIKTKIVFQQDTDLKRTSLLLANDWYIRNDISVLNWPTYSLQNYI